MPKLLIIVLVQLLYVPLLTLRTISMVKNLKVLTAFFGFVEALIYIFGLAIVLSGEQSIAEMLVYAIGFALGLVVGIIVEQKIAIGFSTFQVNIDHSNETLINVLRNEGYGVTVYYGEGKYGKRMNLDILTKRKGEEKLLKLIEKYEPNAFIMAFEPKMFRGGFLTEMMMKRNNKMKRRTDNVQRVQNFKKIFHGRS